MNILFVCTANISRSYVAEALLRNELKQKQAGGHHVRSAGIMAVPGGRADPKMVEFLTKAGIDPGQHEPRPVGEADLQWADRVIVMEGAHAMHIADLWPEAEEKIELMGLYVTPGGHPDDIVDPFGKSSFHYRTALSQIQLAVDNLLRKL